MSMIERVAEAISLSFHEEGYIEGMSDPDEWNEFLKAAKMAIRAMREPTDEMMRAGYPMSSYSNYMYAYRQMIDTALKE